MSEPGSGIFRREALERYARERVEGRLLRLTPRWLPSACWALAGTVVLSLLGLGLYLYLFPSLQPLFPSP